jgi:hypothetical protein
MSSAHLQQQKISPQKKKASRKRKSIHIYDPLPFYLHKALFDSASNSRFALKISTIFSPQNIHNIAPQNGFGYKKRFIVEFDVKEAEKSSNLIFMLLFSLSLALSTPNLPLIFFSLRLGITFTVLEQIECAKKKKMRTNEKKILFTKRK